MFKSETPLRHAGVISYLFQSRKRNMTLDRNYFICENLI